MSPCLVGCPTQKTKRVSLLANPFVNRQSSIPSSGGGTRTPDPTVNSRLLYQLSYSGLFVGPPLPLLNPLWLCPSYH